MNGKALSSDISLTTNDLENTSGYLTQIKTINNMSLEGSGNVNIDGLLKIDGGSLTTKDESLTGSLTNTAITCYTNISKSLLLIGGKSSLFNISKSIMSPYIGFNLTLPIGFNPTNKENFLYISGSATIMDRSGSYPVYGGAGLTLETIERSTWNTTGAVAGIRWYPPLGASTLISGTNINSSINFMCLIPQHGTV